MGAIRRNLKVEYGLRLPQASLPVIPVLVLRLWARYLGERLASVWEHIEMVLNGETLTIASVRLVYRDNYVCFTRLAVYYKPGIIMFDIVYKISEFDRN